MTNSNEIATVLADIQRRLAELGDGRDARSDREKEAHQKAFYELHRRLTIIRSASFDVAPLQDVIVALTIWIDHLKEWRVEFATALTALPAHAPDRSVEQERAMMGLMLAIQNIDFGCDYWPNGRAMLAAPLREKICAAYPPTWDMDDLDPWRVGYGALPYAEQQLAQLIAKRDELQGRLEDAMREPDLAAV